MSKLNTKVGVKIVYDNDLTFEELKEKNAKLNKLAREKENAKEE